MLAQQLNPLYFLFLSSSYCSCFHLTFISAYNSIYSRITSTFQGLSTIRSTHSERVLMDEFHKNLDLNTSAIYLNFATARAFALWLDIICSMYISAVILSFVMFENRGLLLNREFVYPKLIYLTHAVLHLANIQLAL